MGLGAHEFLSYPLSLLGEGFGSFHGRLQLMMVAAKSAQVGVRMIIAASDVINLDCSIPTREIAMLFPATKSIPLENAWTNLPLPIGGQLGATIGRGPSHRRVLS